MGTKIDDFLKEEGIFEEAPAQAVKEVAAWQVALANIAVADEYAEWLLSRRGSVDPETPLEF
jgi:hypothetical protein